MPQLLFSLIVAALTGAAYWWAAAAQRRRKTVQLQMAAMAAAAQGAPASAPLPSLRRAAAPRNWRVRLMPQVAARLQAAAEASGNRVRPGQVVAAGVLSGVVTLGAGGAFGGPSAVVFAGAGAVGLAAAALVVRIAQGRYRRRFLEVFPDALDILVRAVKAGLPVIDAMELAAREIPEPVSTELRRTLDEMRIGVDMQEAFQKTAERIRIADFQFFVVSLGLQRRTGGALAEMMSNLSTLIRRRREVTIKARALTSEARASAVVLSALPPIVGVGLFFVNPDLMRVMLFDPRGHLMLGVSLLTLGVGIALMFALVQRSMR